MAPRYSSRRPAGRTPGFYEESTGRTVRFDCSDLPVSEPARNWLIRRLAERAGARSGVKRAQSFRTGYQVVRDFARSLAECKPPPRHPSEITAEHIRAFASRYEDPQTRRTCVARLRNVLRGCSELPEPARHELFQTRLPVKQTSVQITAYSEAEWQQITTALRRDVRLCRDRIRGGLRLLEQFRAGELDAGSAEAELGDHVRAGQGARSDSSAAPSDHRARPGAARRPRGNRPHPGHQPARAEAAGPRTLTRTVGARAPPHQRRAM